MKTFCNLFGSIFSYFSQSFILMFNYNGSLYFSLPLLVVIILIDDVVIACIVFFCLFFVLFSVAMCVSRMT